MHPGINKLFINRIKLSKQYVRNPIVAHFKVRGPGLLGTAALSINDLPMLVIIDGYVFGRGPSVECEW